MGAAPHANRDPYRHLPMDRRGRDDGASPLARVIWQPRPHSASIHQVDTSGRYIRSIHQVDTSGRYIRSIHQYARARTLACKEGIAAMQRKLQPEAHWREEDE